MTDQDDWHDQLITRERESLKVALAQARTAIRTAELTVEHLRGNYVYDVEYAETAEGDDLATLLKQASMFLRAAEAISTSVTA